VNLLDQVRAVIRKKHYSNRTEQACAMWIERFILFHGKCHPKDMGARKISQYISHLATDQRDGKGMKDRSPPEQGYYEANQENRDAAYLFPLQIGELNMPVISAAIRSIQFFWFESTICNT